MPHHAPTRPTFGRPAYSRAERVSDGVVHVVGVALAVLAVPALILFTIRAQGDAAAITGASVYGATLILMLVCSAIYNMTGTTRWTGILRRMDHSAIYLKIAGTYTPFLLLSATPMPGLFLALWGAAAVGLTLKMVAMGRWPWLALGLYLAMGWAVAFAGGPILSQLPGAVVGLMIAGGVVYTVGVAFHLASRLPFHNTIWHVFVLAGSVLFFTAVTLRIAGLAPAA